MAVSAGALVGRERELQRLQARLSEALSTGQGGLLVLGGEPGIGKTRLLRELSAKASADGVLALMGRAYDVEGMPPYLPFVEALRQWQDLSGADALPRLPGEVASLLPETHADEPSTQSLSPEARRYRLYEQLSDLFIDLARKMEYRGLLLCLDDLHWADSASMQLLQHIARRIATAPVLVVGAYRTVEVEREHPVFTLLAELSRERLAERLTVGPLTFEESMSLLSSLNDGRDPSPATARRLFERSAGNPFYLEELFEHAELRDRKTDLRAHNEYNLPDSLQQIIERRINRLGASVKQVLQAAAVVGDMFDFEILKGVAAKSDGELMEALDSAELTGILVASGAGYAFRHPLLRASAYGSLSETRRRTLHLRTAEALEGEHHAPVEARALHYRHAGSLAPPGVAAIYAFRAAEAAERVFAWSEAINHYEWCLALLPVSSSDSDALLDRAQLYCAVGRAQMQLSNDDDAATAFSKARELFRSRADWTGNALATLPVVVVWMPAEAQKRLIDEALTAPGEPDLHLQALLLVRRARLNLSNERVALESIDAARAIAESGGFKDVEAELLYFQSVRLNSMLKFEEADKANRAAHDAFMALGDQVQAGLALLESAFCFLIPGRLLQAEHRLAEIEEFGAHYSQMYLVECARALLATIDCWRGDLSSASARFPLHADARGLVFSLREAARARTYELRGDLAEARNILEGLAEPVSQFAVQWIYGGLARIHLQAGRAKEAAEAMGRLETLLDGESLRSNVYSSETRWVLPAAFEAFAELAQIGTVEHLYDHYVAIPDYRTTFMGSCDLFRGLLALRLKRFEESRAWLERAIAWAKEESCAVEEGRALIGLARLAEQLGEDPMPSLVRARALIGKSGAHVHGDEAWNGFESAKGRKRPARPGLKTGLTPREVDVLRLIASGISNREIAKALVVSVRTVDRHIANIYAKTGERSKAGATAYAIKHALT